jgi:hypothetical protein
MGAPSIIRFQLPHLSVHDEETIEQILRDQLSDAGLGVSPTLLNALLWMAR